MVSTSLVFVVGVGVMIAVWLSICIAIWAWFFLFREPQVNDPNVLTVLLLPFMPIVFVYQYVKILIQEKKTK